MTDIRIPDDLWTTCMNPEGLLVKWAVPAGTSVQRGHGVAVVEIAGAEHEVLAPASGRLTPLVHEQGLLDVGGVIGRIDPA